MIIKIFQTLIGYRVYNVGRPIDTVLISVSRVSAVGHTANTLETIRLMYPIG